jgi:hypothetical protein
LRHASHPLRKALGFAPRPRSSGWHGAPLHRPPPRARGDEPAGFEGLEVAHRKPWRIGCVVATADHNVSTAVGRNDRQIADPISRLQVDTLDRNVEKFHVKTYFGMKDLARASFT